MVLTYTVRNIIRSVDLNKSFIENITLRG